MEKAPPTKRPRCDATFCAETLRLASESRPTPAAAGALNINARRSNWTRAVLAQQQ